MTVLHAQTLIAEARRARDDKSTRHAGNNTRDLFCAQLVGYLRAYDIHCADELAVLLDMPELTEKELRKLAEEKQS